MKQQITATIDATTHETTTQLGLHEEDRMNIDKPHAIPPVKSHLELALRGGSIQKPSAKGRKISAQNSTMRHKMH